MEAKKPDKDNEEDNDIDKDNDIDTTSKLVSKDAEKLQETIIETLGNTNLTVIRDAIDYLDTLPFEVVQEALIRTARKQKKWDYAQGILNNWIRDGLNSIEKIKANDLEHKNKGTSPPEETAEEKRARKLKALEEARINDT